MKASSLKCTAIGASVMAVISTAYVFFGPTNCFGFPAPRWAAILFYPGSTVGLWTWDHVSQSKPICYTAGVIGMTVVGALLGFVIGTVIQRRRYKRKT
jgi:hypothetical protein